MVDNGNDYIKALSDNSYLMASLALFLPVSANEQEFPHIRRVIQVNHTVVQMTGNTHHSSSIGEYYGNSDINPVRNSIYPLC